MADGWVSDMTALHGDAWEPVFALMAPFPGRTPLANYYASTLRDLSPVACCDLIRTALDQRPDLKEPQ